MKGGILADGLSTLVKLIPLHFALNVSFWRTGRTEFDMHVTSLSSVHLRDLYNTAHQVAAEEDEGLRVVRSWGISFMPTDATQAVLEIIPDSSAAPIAKVVCWTYGRLLCSASRLFD